MPEINQEWKEMIEEMKDEKSNSTSSKRYWSPPSKEEGEFPIRFLPPLKPLGEKKFYFHHLTHWIDGQPYECVEQESVDRHGNRHAAEMCPVCQFVKKLYKAAERDSAEWKLAGDLKAKDRYIYRIIVRNKEDETIPEFYESGQQIFDVLFHIITETDFGIIVDPKNGRDFILTKKGEGRRSRYDTSLPSNKETPIFKEVEKLKTVLENAVKMEYSSLIEFKTSKELKSVLESYISGDSPTKEQLKKKVSKEQREENVHVDTDTNEDEDNEDNDEIDSILSEFTDS
jgi:hypothetical protein